MSLNKTCPSLLINVLYLPLYCVTDIAIDLRDGDIGTRWRHFTTLSPISTRNVLSTGQYIYQWISAGLNDKWVKHKGSTAFHTAPREDNDIGNHCGQFMCYSFRLAARDLLFVPSHTQDSSYHGLCCSN